MIRVMIADDSAFMRMVLKKLFSGADDFEVVGVAHDVQEAFEKVKKLHQSQKWKFLKKKLQ